MIVREKFTPKEWRRAFAKHSRLGYPSDDMDASLEESYVEARFSPVLDVKESADFVQKRPVYVRDIQLDGKRQLDLEEVNPDPHG